MKSNSVYFTDDEIEIDFDVSGTFLNGDPIPPPSENAGKDMGVYDMNEGTIERFLTPRFDPMSSHLWIEQSF